MLRAVASLVLMGILIAAPFVPISGAEVHAPSPGPAGRERLPGISPIDPGRITSDLNSLLGKNIEKYVSYPAGISGTTTGSTDPTSLAAQSGEPVLNHIPITVNVILAGIPSVYSGASAIRSYLPLTYNQIDREQYLASGSSPIYAEYEITYNFVTAPTSFISGYVNWLNTNSRASTPPPWLQGSISAVAEVPSSAAENYVWNNLGLNYNGFTVVLLDVVDSTPSFPYYHFYNASTPDLDYHYDPLAPVDSYETAFGGAHRMLVDDLSSGPSLYHARGCSPSYGCFSIPPPIWAFNPNNSTEASEAVQSLGLAVRFAIEGRFVPSFLYQPTYHPNYLINFTIYSFDPSITWSSLLNGANVANRFSELQQFSSISVQTQEIVNPSVSDPGFYSAFIASFNSSSGMYSNVAINNYILAHLNKYTSSDFVYNGQVIHVLPVVVVAGNDNVDYVGGIAEGNDAGNFAYVLEIYDHNSIGTWIGMTQLTIHEAGHGFGLAHPHDFNDFQFGDIVGWLWDFSSTPMSYAAPNDHYDALAKDNLNQGVTAYVLNQTNYLYLFANSTYNRFGYGVVPTDVASDLSSSSSNYASSMSSYAASNPDYYNAAKSALAARDGAISAITDLYNDLLSIKYLILDGSGRPLQGAELVATLPNGTAVSEVTGSNGSVELDSLPWGDYKYSIVFQGTTVASSSATEKTSSQETIVANVHSLGISGLVTPDGDSLNTPITVTAPNGSVSSVMPGYVQSRAQDGNWDVSVTYEGVQIYHSTVLVSSDTTLKPVVDAERLTVDIVAADKDPLGSVHFGLTAANGTTLSLVGNSTGQVGLGIVPGGNYEVSNITWGGVDVTPSSGTSLSLSRSSTLTVDALVYDLSIKSTDPLGLGVSGARATITGPNGTSLSATSGGDGIATFSNLPVGSYSGSVSFLGQSVPVSLTKDSLASGQVSAPVVLSYPILGIVVVALVGAIGAVVVVRRKGKSSAVEGQPAKAETQ